MMDYKSDDIMKVQKALSRFVAERIRTEEALSQVATVLYERLLGEGILELDKLGSAVSRFSEAHNETIAEIGRAIQPQFNLINSTNLLIDTSSFENIAGWASSAARLMTHELDLPAISRLQEQYSESIDLIGEAVMRSHMATITESLSISNLIIRDALKESLAQFRELGPLFDMKQNLVALFDSFEVNRLGVFAYPPALSRLPVTEYFCAADIAASLLGIESPEAVEVSRKARRNEIVSDSAPRVMAALSSINSSFPSLLEGALHSLDSSNPEKTRHAVTSIRELITHVLHTLAPDSEVMAWVTSDELLHNGRPTRRARLLFISRNINSPPLEEFIESDITAALEFMSILQKGLHEVPSAIADEQLNALVGRAQSLVVFLAIVSGKMS